MDNKKDRWWVIIPSVSKRLVEQVKMSFSSMECRNVGEGKRLLVLID